MMAERSLAALAGALLEEQSKNALLVKRLDFIRANIHRICFHTATFQRVGDKLPTVVCEQAHFLDDSGFVVNSESFMSAIDRLIKETQV